MKNGFNKERDLVDFLLNHGYEAVRVAGSGAGTKRGLPDIIAGNSKAIYAIELKSSSKDNIHIRQEQLKGLIDFSKGFGAIPVVAVKFYRVPYAFLSMNDLRFSKAGNVNISREFARRFKNQLVLSTV